jgi:hypothetical protein
MIFFLRALEATELTDLGILVFVFVVGDHNVILLKAKLQG